MTNEETHKIREALFDGLKVCVPTRWLSDMGFDDIINERNPKAIPMEFD